MVLGTGDLARLLRITARTAGKLCDTGQIRCHRIGAHRRVLLADLVTFMRVSGMPAAWIAEAEGLACPTCPTGPTCQIPVVESNL